MYNFEKVTIVHNTRLYKEVTYNCLNFLYICRDDLLFRVICSIDFYCLMKILAIRQLIRHSFDNDDNSK